MKVTLNSSVVLSWKNDAIILAAVTDFKAVNETGPAIWTIEPHDVLPLGECITQLLAQLSGADSTAYYLLCMLTCVGLFSMSDYLGYFPKHKMIGCLTSACFAVPGMKHIYTWASACSVDKKTLQNLLATGTFILTYLCCILMLKCFDVAFYVAGHSPTICPGGAMEVSFLNHKPECTMYIKKRFGELYV